jgi:hypothetical protein
MSRIPKVFHFIFGLRKQNEPFHLVWYLALKSCLDVNNPEKVVFHYLNEPHGPWWDKIKPSLELVQLGADLQTGIDESLYDIHPEGRFIKHNSLQYAHHADVLRLQILLREGGVYADIDTLFVQPYPEEFYQANCLMGRESKVHDDLSICNAVIMSQPNEPYLSKWLDSLFRVFDGSWNRHSCYEAARLFEQSPELLTLVDRNHFYHFGYDVEDLTDLLGRSVEIPVDLYSIHLWNHLWWSSERNDFIKFHSGLITENFIRSVDTSFNLIARRFLDES